MEIENPVIQFCIAGTQAEFQHKIETAIAYYEQAWLTHTDDFEACIAAHYMARHQKDPKVEYDWNQKALEHAEVCEDDRVAAFLPSLYLNMGKSCEKLGNQDAAQKYYDQASQLGLSHQSG
jgi:tetratricopeptide (TPR) repeat protein